MSESMDWESALLFNTFEYKFQHVKFSSFISEDQICNFSAFSLISTVLL